MMGTWLPETCWAPIKREIKNTKKWHLVGFSYPHSTKNAYFQFRSNNFWYVVGWSLHLTIPLSYRSWQPPCSHCTYQHEAITSRSRQLLMMGTWLPETCWATIRREIKNTKSDIQLVFLIHIKTKAVNLFIFYVIPSSCRKCTAAFASAIEATNCF